MNLIPRHRRYAFVGVITTLIASHVAGAQVAVSDSVRSATDSAKAQVGQCGGGFLARAICKGSAKIYSATVGAGLFENGPTAVGKVSAPAVPFFCTYRVWLIRDGRDSLAYFLRTQTLLHDKWENDPYTGYLGRFHTAMALEDLPSTMAEQHGPLSGRQASGAYMLLLSSRDTRRFGIRLEVSPPALHPAVQAARSWIGDAQTSLPPVESWSKGERERGLTEPMASGDTPTRFSVSWKSGKQQFTVRGERLSDVTVPPGAARR